jgi:xylulokinase
MATGALASGITAAGMVSVAIGTGGQAVAFLERARIDQRLRVHTFCHALPGTWYLLGATLAAGLAFRWLRETVANEAGSDAYDRMTARAARVPPGSEGLLFLPYLVGERTVEDLPPSRAVFFGLTPRHERAHLIRATMEGITLALRRPLDVFREMGVAPQCIVASGGGARSTLWRQMMADILQTPVVQLAVHEQSAMGAAILAGIGTGVFGSAAEACSAFVRYGRSVEPQPSTVTTYQAAYERFCALYEHVQPDFAQLQGT